MVAHNKTIQNKDYPKLLKKILGFKPKNMELYFLAFTHKSFDPEETDGYYNNNERLEYLGDAILDAAVSDLLYKRFPTADEGFLTKLITAPTYFIYLKPLFHNKEILVINNNLIT